MWFAIKASSASRAVARSLNTGTITLSVQGTGSGFIASENVSLCERRDEEAFAMRQDQRRRHDGRESESQAPKSKRKRQPVRPVREHHVMPSADRDAHGLERVVHPEVSRRFTVDRHLEIFRIITFGQNDHARAWSIDGELRAVRRQLVVERGNDRASG